MGSKLSSRFLIVVVVGLFPFVLSAEVSSPKAILEVSAIEQMRFVSNALEKGFPIETADHVTMLVLNRSDVVLPLLLERVLMELRTQSPIQKLVATSLEMIVYAGDATALRTVAKLMAVDEERFVGLVGRTLDNAISFRNPYTVAYEGLDIGNTSVDRQIVLWSENSLNGVRMQRLFGEALKDRYRREPDEGQWATDPIASRINASQRQRLQGSVLRYAAEAKLKSDR